MSRSQAQMLIAPGVLIAGKYKLVRQIGEGAMGAVWSAVNVATARDVALKLIIRPEPEFRMRMQREARNCGALRHRNVIDVYDMGETESGDPFLVMPLLTGETLAELLARKRRLAPEVAAAIGRDVARGLAAAHALHIVHRDLKPANIFLHREQDVDEPVVKVLDFGVAKNLAVNDGLHTVVGGAVGSPLYMSPEQARTEPNVDPRADIWALGVVLFEMLTGVRPFQGDAREVLSGILTGEIPTVAKHVRRVDPGLVEIVARCMRRDRSERFGSAAEIAVKLDHYAAHGAGAGASSLRQTSPNAQAQAMQADSRPRVAGEGTAGAESRPVPPSARASVSSSLELASTAAVLEVSLAPATSATPPRASGSGQYEAVSAGLAETVQVGESDNEATLPFVAVAGEVARSLRRAGSGQFPSVTGTPAAATPQASASIPAGTLAGPASPAAAHAMPGTQAAATPQAAHAAQRPMPWPLAEHPQGGTVRMTHAAVVQATRESRGAGAQPALAQSAAAIVGAQPALAAGAQPALAAGAQPAAVLEAQPALAAEVQPAAGAAPPSPWSPEPTEVLGPEAFTSSADWRRASSSGLPRQPGSSTTTPLISSSSAATQPGAAMPEQRLQRDAEKRRRVGAVLAATAASMSLVVAGAIVFLRAREPAPAIAAVEARSEEKALIEAGAGDLAARATLPAPEPRPSADAPNTPPEPPRPQTPLEQAAAGAQQTATGDAPLPVPPRVLKPANPAVSSRPAGSSGVTPSKAPAQRSPLAAPAPPAASPCAGLKFLDKSRCEARLKARLGPAKR